MKKPEGCINCRDSLGAGSKAPKCSLFMPSVSDDTRMPEVRDTVAIFYQDPSTRSILSASFPTLASLRCRSRGEPSSGYDLGPSPSLFHRSSFRLLVGWTTSPASSFLLGVRRARLAFQKHLPRLELCLSFEWWECDRTPIGRSLRPLSLDPVFSPLAKGGLGCDGTGKDEDDAF